MKLRCLLPTFLVVLILSSSGCGGGQSKFTLDDARAEYLRETAKLEAPPESPFPGIRETSDGYPILYSPGQATQQAQVQFVCLWEGEWVRSRSDKERSAKGLSELAKVPNMDLYQRSWDEVGRRTFDSNLVSAKLGDPGPIQQDLDLNC